MRQKCEEAEHCIHTRERLEECETRVGSRSSTEEDCTEELFDFLHARDHCVSMTYVPDNRMYYYYLLNLDSVSEDNLQKLISNEENKVNLVSK